MEKHGPVYRPYVMLGIGFLGIGLIALWMQRLVPHGNWFGLTFWPVLGVLNHSLPLLERLGMLFVVVSSGLYLYKDTIPTIMLNTLGMLIWAIGVVYLGHPS